LGTCWCGAFDEESLAEILRLEKDMRPVAIIPIGYPAGEPVFPTKRRPVEEIITFVGGVQDDGNTDAEDEETQRKIERCDMGGAIFNDVNLGNSAFNNINFYGVDITDANLTDGKIHDCNLSNLEIYDCLLDGMTVNGKNICELVKD
jgi:hypothetical protein